MCSVFVVSFTKQQPNWSNRMQKMEGASTAFHSDGHHRKEKQKLRGSAKAEIRLAWASIRKNCVLGCAQRQSASSVLSELQEPMARAVSAFRSTWHRTGSTARWEKGNGQCVCHASIHRVLPYCSPMLWIAEVRRALLETPRCKKLSRTRIFVEGIGVLTRYPKHKPVFP